MEHLRLAVFADGEVGYRTLRFLRENHADDLIAVVLTDDSQIQPRLVDLGIDGSFIFSHSSLRNNDVIDCLQSLKLDYILLAWWPHIIRQPILSIPQKGILNYHPSFLPYNRGKHYNFWTFVEDTPFGVTIHYVDEEVDSGDIVFQKIIKKTWEDTGESLYNKAQVAMIELFIESYPKLITGDFQVTPQDLQKGSFHYAKELDPASVIDLDSSCTGKGLLNLIRARTFPPYPSCSFQHKGKKYDVTVKIKEMPKGIQEDSSKKLLLDKHYEAQDILLPNDIKMGSNRWLHFTDEGIMYQANLSITRSKT